MPLRATNASMNASIAKYTGMQRQRMSVAQEQLTSGKRINRPSDDPVGAGAVLRIRTSQAQIGQFRRSAAEVKDRAFVTDSALDSHERLIEHARTTLAQGASSLTSSTSREALADQIDSLRTQMLSIANMRSRDQYVFGGTRQDAPPFDPTSASPAITASSVQLAQIEPEASPITVGATAETVFSDASGTIFQTLTNVAAALRGTGDEAADKTTIMAGLDRLQTFADLAGKARVQAGVQINSAEGADERLNQNSLLYEASAERIEGADFVSAALELTNAQTALDATLQASSNIGRRSLIDFLG